MAESTLLQDGIPRMKDIVDQMPKNIDFGFCAVGQPTEKVFKLTNYSDYEKRYTFEKCIFHIEPMSDSIPAKTTKQVKVSFVPSEATVIVASTILTVEDEGAQVIKFSAIGKFPFLKTQSSKIDFEDVIYGRKRVKELIINNASEVSTKFEIRKLEIDEYADNSFSLDYDQGFIPPKSSFLVKITYKPMVWDLFSCSHYEVQCIGGNKIEVQCMGRALSIDARLSSKTINFGSIRLNSSTNRVVTLHNNSDANCNFEVIIENAGIFSVQEATGIIKPRAYARLLFLFSPQKCINYYQRVYILIRNHLALYLDLIGNCYDLLIKPPPMLPTLPRDTRQQVGLETGQSFLPKSPGGTVTDEEGFNEVESSKAVVAQSNLIHKELFGGSDLSEKFLRVDSKFLDFGYSNSSGSLPVREVTIENISGKKLSIFWTNDAPHFEIKENIFSVYPASVHMKHGESVKFTITFKPVLASAFFCERIQAFAIDYDTNVMEKITKASFAAKKRMIAKSNLSKVQLQDEIDMDRNISPIELEILCFGHSFSPETQPFIPMVQVLPRNEIYFSPCGVGETAYNSIQLLNKTDTPSFFKFDADSSGIFDVFPKQGIIEGHRFKIIFFKFNPKEPNLYQKVIHCRLNNSVDVIKLKVTGYCCKPKLEIGNECQVFFPPSFLGVHSKQKISFHNMSRVPLTYIITLPQELTHEVRFTPTRNILLPNQTEYVTCSLMPLKKKKYQIRVPVEVHGEIVNETIVEDQVLEIYGEGGDGSVVIKPDILDFGIVKVNFQVQRKITIYNHSHVTFFLQLQIKASDSDKPEGEAEDKKINESVRRAINNSFQMDFTEGIVTGHSKLEVTITFRPVEICDLNVRLICLAKEKPPYGMIGLDTVPTTTEKCSISLRALGHYPILKVIDIRNEDLSVSTLWNNFRLDDINRELLDKSEGKVEQKDFEDLANTTEKDEQINKHYHEWNFGYLQKRTVIEPRRVVVTLQNIGGTDLNWKFKFPNDNPVKLYYLDQCRTMGRPRRTIRKRSIREDDTREEDL